MRNLIALSALLTALPMAIAAQTQPQTITFSNANPVVSVELLPASQLALDPQGNLTAQCAPGVNGCQRLTQGGAGGQCGSGVAFTSQLTVTTPTNPAPPGPYPGGSQLTIAAQMTGAIICEREAFLPPSAPTSVSGWSGSIAPTGNVISQAITLPTQASTSYLLRLTCFGSTGSSVSNLTVTTSGEVNPPPPPPPPTCPTIPAYTSASPGDTGPTPISGVTVRTINGFETLRDVSNIPLAPFPQAGGAGIVNEIPSVVRVLRFNVPNPFIAPFTQGLQFFSWPNGFNQGIDAYISVSSCPGDLRIPTAIQSGTAGDTTYAEGCRTWRGFSWRPGVESGFGDIPYVISPGQQASPISTPNTCVLVPGKTYYINIIMNQPNLNRTLPPMQLPPNTLCGAGAQCGHRINAGS